MDTRFARIVMQGTRIAKEGNVVGQFGKEYTHQEFWQLFNERFGNSEEFENAFNKRAAWEKVYYDLAWGNPDAHVVVRHLLNDHKFKLEIYIEDEKQSGLFKKLESYKEDIQHEFEENVVFTSARTTGDNTDSKAKIIYIEKTDVKEIADDEYWNEQIDWIQAMSLKLKGIVDMYGNDKKYSVNDSVWIAAAILAYEKYKEDPEHVSGKDLYFKQSKIVNLAQNFTANNVDNARVSWWVNADNEKHTQNYLRADLKEEQSFRRLSMMDEFEEKCYPLSLDPDASLSADGKTYLMGELLQFVREVYPPIIQKMLTELEINYKAVLDYLENNQEIPYSNPEATGITEEKRNELLEIKQRGQDAVAEMKKMANRCNELYGLDKCIPGSWLDGSNTKTRKYLWTQMKYKAYEDNPISVSLFVEKNNKDTRYSISLEIKNDGTDKQTMAKYHSYLDIPIDSGMVFVAGSNEWGNPAVIEDTQESIK